MKTSEYYYEENSDINIDALGLNSDEVGEYTLPPEGSHLARCIGLVQLGTQKGEYQGKPSKDRRKIMLIWELPEEKHIFDEAKGEEPFVVSQIYSLVLGEKSTWQIQMESWTGGRIDRNFNPLNRLGQPCILTIAHKPSVSDPTRIRAKITAVSKLVKNQICPDRVNPLRILLFSKWDEALFEQQSEFVRKMIEASPEYKEMKLRMRFVEGNREGQWIKSSDDRREDR